jgi:hypothetical protein
VSLTPTEQKINHQAHTLDSKYDREGLKKLRATCKHKWVGTWDGFDRCEICGQPGQPDIALPTDL